MSFLSQFSKHFTSEEQKTELYQLWSQIGVNTEKAICEEQTAVNNKMTDISHFDEDVLRSWLAFCLMKIPYRTSATTQISVQFDGSFGETTIPKYSKLKSDKGVIYTQMEEIKLTSSAALSVTAVQGNRITASGTYNDLIKIQVNNPDLSYLTVKVGNKEISEVKYQTSYDQLKYLGSWKPQNLSDESYGGNPKLDNSYGDKGDFYTVIADGKAKFGDTDSYITFKTGDLVVFDGTEWQLNSQDNNLTPIQFANSFAIPRNGYFAYYYDGYLYIKVFTGSDVDNPENQTYEVSYIVSDGIQGEIGKDTLSYVESITDVSENTVSLIVSNTKSSSAINEPSVGKLSVYLKQRLFSSINVSSIPEYQNWFNSQPEVGDCIVLSDYEKWIAEGKPSEYILENVVNTYLLDNEGNCIYGDDYSAIVESLLSRISKVKDIGVVQINKATKIQHAIIFTYNTCSNTSKFVDFVKTRARLRYNMSYIHSINDSLFNDLDLASLMKDIQDNCEYESTGLVVKGYHYTTATASEKFENISLYSYERATGGWYKLTYTNTSGNTTVITLKELSDPSGTCRIYDTDSSKINEESWGTRSNNIINITIPDYVLEDKSGTATLECFIPMEDDGILTTAYKNNDVNSNQYIATFRNLAKIAVVNSNTTLDGSSSDFWTVSESDKYTE